MSSNNGHVVPTVSKVPGAPSDAETGIAIDQLQHLIRMLDQSDVSELEVRFAATNTRVVLRKARVREETGMPVEALFPSAEDDAASLTPPRHIIRAPFVGIFHRWSRTREPLQMAVGDTVTEGQHVGFIQSLDIFHEVEANVAGSIAEILVEDGQPVEFGQPLLAIDTH